MNFNTFSGRDIYSTPFSHQNPYFPFGLPPPYSFYYPPYFLPQNKKVQKPSTSQNSQVKLQFEQESQKQQKIQFRQVVAQNIKFQEELKHQDNQKHEKQRNLTGINRTEEKSIDNEQISKKFIILRQTNDRFVKKNIESNIVNQIFSFLWSPEKNKQALIKVIPDLSKRQIFCKALFCFKSLYKKDCNRQFLKKIINEQQWEKGFSKLKQRSRKLVVLTLPDFVLTLRKLIRVYLKDIVVLFVFTSRKMNPSLWYLHLKKCREIEEYLFRQDLE